MHTHHWTEQDGSKVDLDINNLCMFVLDGVLPRATLEMRIPGQPARASVASIFGQYLLQAVSGSQAQ